MHWNLTPRCCTYDIQLPVVPNNTSHPPPPPTSNLQEPPLVAGPQESQYGSSSVEAPTSRQSDKENVRAAHSSVDGRSPAASQPSPRSAVVIRRRHTHQEQPIAGPSSVTLDDLSSAESQGSDVAQELAHTKRPRSTRDEVSSVQTAARKAALCGLDGGECKHTLKDDTTENKQHIKDAHPCNIPSNAGTPTSTTGTLYYKGRALSDAKVREHVAKGSLACTWSTPGAARCGSVLSGRTAEANLARHVEEIHWGREFACDLCTPRRRFGSLRALQVHMKKHRRAGGVDVPKGGKTGQKDEDADEGEGKRTTKRRRVM